MNKKKLVVLSGAGISAESGLKTFRDSDGLWEGYKITDVATPAAFIKNPKLVLDFYNFRRKAVAEAQPNIAHHILAELEQHFDVHIVTQNIDDLHERAGSTKVLHLHGEIFKMRSVNNQTKTFEIRGDIQLGDRSPIDGGQMRPHIVWFGEAVPMIETAVPIMRSADYFILVGTSLVVYPAAGLVDYVNDDVKKFIVDKKIPPVTDYINIVPIELPATEGMVRVKELLMREK